MRVRVLSGMGLARQLFDVEHAPCEAIYIDQAILLFGCAYDIHRGGILKAFGSDGFQEITHCETSHAAYAEKSCGIVGSNEV